MSAKQVAAPAAALTRSPRWLAPAGVTAHSLETHPALLPSSQLQSISPPACRDSFGEEQQRAASPQSRDSNSHGRSRSLAEVLSSEQPSSLRIVPVRPSSAHSLMRPGVQQPHWYSPQPGGRGSADGTPGSPAPSLASVATCPPSLARDGPPGDDAGGMIAAEAGSAAEAGLDRTPDAGLLGQKRPSGMLLPPHEEDRKFPLKRLFEGLHEMQLGKEQSTAQKVCVCRPVALPSRACVRGARCIWAGSSLQPAAVFIFGRSCDVVLTLCLQAAQELMLDQQALHLCSAPGLACC